MPSVQLAGMFTSMVLAGRVIVSIRFSTMWPRTPPIRCSRQQRTPPDALVATLCGTLATALQGCPEVCQSTWHGFGLVWAKWKSRSMRPGLAENIYRNVQVVSLSIYIHLFFGQWFFEAYNYRTSFVSHSGPWVAWLLDTPLSLSHHCIFLECV